MQNNPKQIALIILDGWGHREDTKDNAIASARTPFFDSLLKNYPHTLLDASEENVGLPEGTIGNSEIGHMTMGAGRTINTDLVRITKAIESGDFDKRPAFAELFSHIKKYDSTLHVLGLLSPIGVHSHQEHLHAFLKLAKEAGIKKIAIHAFTDGRDSPPQESFRYLEELEKVLADLGIGHIASATGRYYAMDRDRNWDRTLRAEEAIFECKGEICRGIAPSKAMLSLREKGVLDEHLEPVVFLDRDGNGYKVEDNDGIFFFNFRTDRPRQLCERIIERSAGRNVFLCTLTKYSANINSAVAFPPVKVENTLADVLEGAHMSQDHIAETEKYAHVTYFFNGERKELHERERNFLIESRKDVTTHDMAPEMRAREIADRAVESINEGVNFLVINFANADIVGHTANVKAIITAVETVDRELSRIVEALGEKGGVAFITADHGNAEMNVDRETGEKHTAHTLNRVPAIITKKGLSITEGTLADIAPTILTLYGMSVPTEMTGHNLIK